MANFPACLTAGERDTIYLPNHLLRSTMLASVKALPPGIPPSFPRPAVLHLATITAPFFPALAELGEFERVEPGDMPPDYQTLLAHNDHMTVTVEAFHGSEVDVRVLQEHREGEVYSRTSLLVCRSTGRVVQLGIVRINLHGLSQEVREEIESRRIPLGRVLIRHNVLRRVELQRLWRIWPGPRLCEHLELTAECGMRNAEGASRDAPAECGMEGGQMSASHSPHSPFRTPHLTTSNPQHPDCIYGRSAGIFVEGRPAVELLEIVIA
jgi:chorismate-pyruvate lyase